MATHAQIRTALLAALADVVTGPSDAAPAGYRITAVSGPDFEKLTGVRMQEFNTYEPNNPLASRYREGAHRGYALSDVVVMKAGNAYYSILRVVGNPEE